MSRLLARAFRFRLFLIALCVAGSVAGSVGMALWPLEAGNGTKSPREIVLIARDMAFYIEGHTTPNPAIHLERGEQIALTLRNEDTGMTHDFSLSDWGVRTRKLKGEGSDRIVFDVPDAAESGEYVCTPHSLMMRGSVVID